MITEASGPSPTVSNSVLRSASKRALTDQLPPAAGGSQTPQTPHQRETRPAPNNAAPLITHNNTRLPNHRRRREA
ncbi:MAG: hypothetical protein LBD24_03655 [Spirochaetaceae bacterium]|nr:hypothetical protein [Spirochaetaceae bacterium]